MRKRPVPAVVIGLVFALATGPVAAATPPPATGTWAAIGPAVPALFGAAKLHWVDNVGQGPDGKLYIAGWFEDAGGDPTADNLAVYDPVDGSIRGLGSDGAGDGALSARVFDVAFMGGMVYAAGEFVSAGGVFGATGLARWTGSAWERVGTFTASHCYSLAVSGGSLYIAGYFENAGGEATADHVARWDGAAWHGLGNNGAGNGALTDGVRRVLPLPDGRVFVAGWFTNAGGNADADYLAWWDPTALAWKQVGPAGSAALTSQAYTVAVLGQRVVVGGEFLNAGGDPLADYAAEWNGTAWTHLGTNGAAGPALNLTVMDLVFSGSTVIVGGGFTGAGGITSADGIAAWSGTKWLSLGGVSVTNWVYGLTPVGRTLYMAGGFADLASIPEADGAAAYGLAAAPTAPRGLAATSKVKKVALAWKVPASANGLPITDYVVQYRKVGTTVWKTFADGVKTTRTAVVTGLKSGTSYQFRVRAVNDWGIGPVTATVTKKAW